MKQRLCPCMAQAYSIESSGSCFDLFGLDVIFDTELTPHVMEINEGPDMVCHSKWPVEMAAKSEMVSEIQ